MTENTTDQEFVASADVATFVRKNVGYYRKKWEAVLAKRGSLDAIVGKNPLMIGAHRTGWNWAAFFVAPLWLAYRKMWVHAIAMVVLILGLVSYAEYSGNRTASAGTAIAIAFALWGNTYYLRYVRRRVLEIQKLTPDLDARRVLLVNAGGTSWAGVAGIIVLLVGGTAAITMRDEVAGLTSDLTASDADHSRVPTQQAATAKPVQVAGWEDWIADMNGIWQEPNGNQIRVYFTPQLLHVELGGPLDRTITLKIAGTDPDNESVTFNTHIRLNSVPPREDDTEMTFRKAWNDTHTTFQVLVFQPPSVSERLGFVRRFLPNEVADLEKSAATAMAQVGSPQGSTATGPNSPATGATAPVQTAALPADELSALAQKLPYDLFDQELRRPALDAMGNRYDDFFGGLNVSSGIDVIDNTFLVGNGCASHLCTVYESFFVYNGRTHELFAATTAKGQPEIVSGSGMNVPDEIATKFHAWEAKFKK